MAAAALAAHDAVTLAIRNGGRDRRAPARGGVCRGRRYLQHPVAVADAHRARLALDQRPQPRLIVVDDDEEIAARPERLEQSVHLEARALPHGLVEPRLVAAVAVHRSPARRPPRGTAARSPGSCRSAAAAPSARAARPGRETRPARAPRGSSPSRRTSSPAASTAVSATAARRLRRASSSLRGEPRHDREAQRRHQPEPARRTQTVAARQQQAAAGTAPARRAARP